MNTTLVALQSSRLGECLVAHVADVGPYVLVAHVVHCETRTFSEDFVAVVELTNEALFSKAML